MKNPLRIAQYPDPILRKRAAAVERVTPEIATFIAQMRETMYASHGVGLAAPQVGISLRIIVVDTDDIFFALINPQIIARGGTQTGVEGCLSLPDLHAEVTRAMQVTIQGLNLRGKRITLSGDGLWARAMQHETDHLDGVLFIDQAAPDSFRWATNETDAEGHIIERPTSLEDALRVFERAPVPRA